MSDDSIEGIIKGLIKAETGGHQLVHLDLSQNDMTQHSVPVICQFLKSENGWKLKNLILDRNNLYDGGIQQLAVGLIERYQIFENNKPQNSTQAVLPIQYLGLADTKFTDSVRYFYS